jgi:hypothetical protein
MDEKRFNQFVEDFERVSASKDTLRASFSFFEINWAFIQRNPDPQVWVGHCHDEPGGFCRGSLSF